MVAPKEVIPNWLEWLAGWADGARNVRDIDGLLRAYAVAAQQAGYDQELVERIAAIPSMEPRYGPAAVEEILSVAAEARRRSAEHRSWSSVDGRRRERE